MELSENRYIKNNIKMKICQKIKNDKFSKMGRGKTYHFSLWFRFMH